nr:MAG TPA: hypothetical protein [Caudoviricetes sp.]
MGVRGAINGIIIYQKPPVFNFNLTLNRKCFIR